jgi:ABC-type Fe3+/spermidine/putrescine transport system ATPase subunit/ABC-type sulfate transport system permease component
VAASRPALWRSPLPWLAALLLAYLTGPVLVFVARSAERPTSGFSVPGLFGALATSAVAATISGVLVALLGIPLAYLLARHRGPLASAASLAVQLPLALPPLVSGVVLLYVFGPYTFLGRLSGGRFTESLAGIVLAQSFVASPFLVVAARSAFHAIDPNLEDVAATAGVRPLGRFARVALPLAGPGIRAGLVLTWLRAFGEYGATVMLSYHPYSVPVFTYVQFSAIGLPATQAPALLALGVAAVVVALSRAPVPSRRRRRAPEPLERAAAAVPPAFGAGARAVPVAFDLSNHAGNFRLDLRYAATGHRLAIIGPSGAGKSLTMRALAGLAPGKVSFAGRPVGDLPPERRQVGYVPQGQGLMPHLDAWENIMIGPHANAGAAAYWMEALGIAELARRKPAQMSGGQRQRVNLARAFSCLPEVVLLDEPFTGLDAPARTDLLAELRRLQREAGFSSVIVTHDFSEAALLADEVLVISGGRALQSGPLSQVFDRPTSPEVARILGLANVFGGTAASPREVATGRVVLATGPHGVPAGEPVSWCVRPEHVLISARELDRALLARLDDVAVLGARAFATVTLAGGTDHHPVMLQVEVAGLRRRWPPAGSPCWVEIPPEAVLVWPEAGG